MYKVIKRTIKYMSILDFIILIVLLSSLAFMLWSNLQLINLK